MVLSTRGPRRSPRPSDGLRCRRTRRAPTGRRHGGDERGGRGQLLRAADDRALYFWRASASVAATLFAMANVDPVGLLDRPVIGVAKPTTLVFQGIFGLGCAVTAFTAVQLV